jgi:hypothetical protein
MKERVCNRCGEIERQSIPKKDVHVHTWDAGVVTKDPTCTESGTETFTCTECGETRTESIPALGHDWSDWTVTKEPTTTEEGMKERVCNRCGEIERQSIPKKDVHVHTWGEWTVDVEPAPTHDGSKHRTCSGCGEVQTSELIYKGTETVVIRGDSSTTTVIPQGGSWIAESELKAEVSTMDGAVIIIIPPSAVSQALEQLTKVDDGKSDITVVISVKADTRGSGTATLDITSEDLEGLSDLGDYTLRCSTGLCTVEMGSDILSGMEGGGVTLTFVSGTASGYPGVSHGRSVDITMGSSGAEVHGLRGTVSVHVPYPLPAGSDGKDVRVWYVDGNRLVKVDASYDAAAETADFGTDHLSRWIVGVEAEEAGGSSGSDMALYIAIGAIAVVAVIAAAVIMMKKGRSTE